MSKESMQKIFKREDPQKEEKPKDKIVQVDDYRSELTPANEARLRELRKAQNSLEPGAFSDADSRELLELVAKKENTENKPLTNEEEQEWLEITKDQTDNNDWTPEKSNRFIKLNNRREKHHRL